MEEQGLAGGAAAEQDGRQGGESAKRAIRGIVATVVFLALTCVLVSVLSFVTQPKFGDHTTESIGGMYRQPKDSVQVGFFGTSVALAAFSPIEYYKEYGFTGYNCANPNQPLMTTCYLLEDMISRQGGSLKVAVIDPTRVFYTDADERRSMSSWAERVVLSMPPSVTKLKTILNVGEDYPDVKLIEQLIPLLKYHSRWSELTEGDFDFTKVERGLFTHGYRMRFKANADSNEEGVIETPTNTDITDEREASEEKLRNLWSMKEKGYLDRFVALCRQNNIDVLFVKIPCDSWTNHRHDSMMLLAEQYGAPVVDLNDPEITKELGLSYATDYVDAKHPNIRGTVKISDYLGKYLDSHYDLEDVRKSGYSYVQTYDDDAATYDRLAKGGELFVCETIEDYLDLLDNEEYTTFITVKGDAAEKLSSTARSKAKELGLENLANIDEGQSYVGVIDGGKVCVDRVEANTETGASVSGTYRNGEVVVDKGTVKTSAERADSFVLKSAGEHAGNVSSMMIDTVERSENGGGINFAVYNRLHGELLDTSSFDTHVSSNRTPED